MKATQFWQKWFRRAPKTSDLAIAAPGSLLLRWQHLQQHLLQYEGWPWLIPFLMAGATVITASSWILLLPPLPDCRHLSLLTSDGDRLYCADQAARNGNLPSLAQAIETVSQWPTDHPLFPQAKRRVDEWSLALLVIARQQLSQGNIELATMLLQKIPKTAIAYDQAQELLTATNIGEGGNLLSAAEAAIRQQDWGLALLQVKLMNQLGTDYWQEQAQKLSTRISQEQDAWGTLVQARDLAGWLTANELAEAVMLALSIPRNAVVYGEAQADIRRWIPEVFEYAQERLNNGDTVGALALIEKIAPALDVSYHDRSIVILGQAKALAAQDTVLGYWEAIARVQQIPAKDPFYGAAREYLAQWQQQLQSASQLQLSTWFASSHWRWGYELAIQQAQQIPLGQPKRPQAQGLIAQWRRDLRTIDEQPILNAAIALAEQKEYAAAIQIVERLPANAALLAIAQQHRQDWQIKLEELVDRPILDRAITLAREGKLEEAITTAAQIKWDRYLYREAQNKIWQWEYELAVRSRRQEEQTPAESWWEAPPPTVPETAVSSPEPTASPDTAPEPELPSPTPTATEPPPPSPSPEASAIPTTVPPEPVPSEAVPEN
ncbi:hypothetical protein [Parathermosynechococcus lividus]